MRDDFPRKSSRVQYRYFTDVNWVDDFESNDRERVRQRCRGLWLNPMVAQVRIIETVQTVVKHERK